MYKVVINRCYGGFGLSKEALWLLESEYGAEVVGEDGDGLYLLDYIERHDKRLVSVVDMLGSDAASGEYSDLHIEEISVPLYMIHDNDGKEWVEVPPTYDYILIKDKQ